MLCGRHHIYIPSHHTTSNIYTYIYTYWMWCGGWVGVCFTAFLYQSVVLLSINTLRPRKVAISFQRTFSNAFSWKKIYKFGLKFHWSFFLRVQLTMFHHWYLVQIMAWRRPGDKPLSEPMMVRLPTHICVTRPQWVKDIADELSCHEWKANYPVINARHLIVYMIRSLILLE